MKTIVGSFSGGKSSAMMCYLLETSPRYKDAQKVYLFANTGRELPQTISFVRDVARELNIKVILLEAVVNHAERKSTSYKVVEDYAELSMDGKPYEDVIKKYGLPSIAFPHCTRELKVNPIKSYLRDLGFNRQNALQAIGMRFDEPKRIKNDSSLIYPLYDFKVDKLQVNEFCKEFFRYNLDIEDFEGNCDFCFKKSWRKLEKMYAKYPTRTLWWNEMENKYYKENAEIFRGHKVIFDLAKGASHNDTEISCACGKDPDNFF